MVHFSPAQDLIVNRTKLGDTFGANVISILNRTVSGDN